MTHSIDIVSQMVISVISLLTMYTRLLGAAACFMAVVTGTDAFVPVTVKQTVSCCCGCSLLHSHYAGMSWQVMVAEAHLGHTVSPSPVHQLAQMAVALGRCSAKTAVFQPAGSGERQAIMRQVRHHVCVTDMCLTCVCICSCHILVSLDHRALRIFGQDQMS